MSFPKKRPNNNYGAWRLLTDEQLVEELVKLGMDREEAKEYAEFGRNAIPQHYKDRLPK